jgi:hypothetical protein
MAINMTMLTSATEAAFRDQRARRTPSMRLAAQITGTAAAILFGVQAWSAAVSVGSGDRRIDDLLLCVDQTIINAVLLVMAWMLLRRHFSILFLPVALFLGEAVYDGGVLIGGLHGLLQEMPAYHWAFGRHSTAEVNPQYGMLLVYVALLATLLGSQFFRRWRTFDRMLAAVCAIAILSTFTLFHVFLLGGIQGAIRQEARILSTAFVDGGNRFLQACSRVEAGCQVIDRRTPSVDEAGKAVDAVAARTVFDVAARGASLREPFVWSGSTSQDKTRTKFYVFAVATAGDHVLLARAGRDLEKAVAYERLRFTVQSVAAHATWLAIFCLISAVHRKKARPTIRHFVGADGFA